MENVVAQSPLTRVRPFPVIGNPTGKIAVATETFHDKAEERSQWIVCA